MQGKITDWNMLRLALELRRAGSVSGAAVRLGVNHATVSRQLARAEATLGRRLFHRMPTGLVPTEAGAALAKRGERIEAETLAVDLDLGPLEEDIAGPLALTVPPLIADDDLAADLGAFTKRHPGIALRILGDNRVLDLHRREADVALRVTRSPSGSLWGRKLVEQRAGFFASPSFLAEHADGLAGAAPLPIVSFTAWSEPLPASIRDLFPTARIGVTCDDMAAAMALARKGHALLRAPFFVGNNDPGLVAVPNAPSVAYAPIWVLTHPDLRKSARITAFMHHLADGFAARKDKYIGHIAGD